jgi:hypothetical protein
MDVWGWIAVYAVGLTLLQLLVYRYLLNSGGSLRRRVGTPFSDGDGERDASWMDGSSSPPGDSGSARSPGDDDTAGRDVPSSRGLDAWPKERAHVASRPQPRPAETDGRPCRHCGAVNEADQTFTRCWNCTSELRA